MENPTIAMAIVPWVVLAACDASSVHAPPSTNLPPIVAAMTTSWSASNCPAGLQGFECRAATRVAHSMTADPDTVAQSCAMEACSGEPGWTFQVPDVLDFRVDYLGAPDAILIRCVPNGPTKWFENDVGAQGCWDCMGRCSGPACPNAAMCVDLGPVSGSDCQAFTCDDSTQLTPGSGHFQAPYCKRPGPPPVPGATNSTADLVGLTPRLRWSPVAHATSYHIYRQIEWMGAPAYWNQVADTVYVDESTWVSGAPSQGIPGAKWVRYHVVAVNASGTGGFTKVHYYPYTFPIPY